MEVKQLLFLFIFLILISGSQCQYVTSITENEQFYRYSKQIRYCKHDSTANRLYIFVPVPQSNDYHTISNLNIPGGELLINTGSNDRYVRYILEGDDIKYNEWGEVFLEFDYCFKNTEFTTQQVDEIYPYDTTSEIYRMYSKKRDAFTNTDNPTLYNASNTLWDESTDVYDYAKRCFDYIDEHFEFKNMGTGWLTIDQLVANGGGDCGNLSSLYITLLRCKKVPARLVMMPGHAWAEFYLENYGWIPVDPTFHLFGRASSSYNRIIWGNEVMCYLKFSDADSLYHHINQYPHLFFNHDQFHCDEIISSVPISTVNIFDNDENIDIAIYPNPAQNTLKIECPGLLQNNINYNIIDITGNIMQQGKLNGHTIDVSKLSSGWHILNVIVENRTISKKFILK